jgi:hypothetical protein
MFSLLKNIDIINKKNLNKIFLEEKKNYLREFGNDYIEEKVHWRDQ